MCSMKTLPRTSTPPVLWDNTQLPGHKVSDMELVPIECVRGGRAVRKIRERALIRKFEFVENGLNIYS